MTAKKKDAVVDDATPKVTTEPPTEVRDNPYAAYEDILAGRITLTTSPTVPGAKVLPRIMGGNVEFDGLPYTQSPIYAKMDVFCSYCGQPPHPARTMHAYLPEGDDAHVIFVCSDYTCTNSHYKKFTADGSVLPQ